MTQKEMMQEFAMKEFETCIQKHGTKVKNVLYTLIGHAYNEGYKEGMKQAQTIEEAVKPVEIGDVFVIDRNGGMFAVIGKNEEDAMVLYDDLHTGLYALELLEEESGVKRIHEKFDIVGKFNQMKGYAE